MKNKSFSHFLVVWTGQFFSGLGTGMTAFALGVYVFNQTRSTMSFALVLITLFVPSILISPIGGALADRFGRRLLIIVGDAGSAGAVAFLLICHLTGGLTLWMIYLGVALGSAFTALQGPAYKASLSDMVREDHFARAGGMIQLASSTRYLVAPVCAGYLMSRTGIEWILVLDILTFVFAVWAVTVVPAAEKRGRFSEKEPLIQSLIKAWKGLAVNPVVSHLVLKLAVVTFFTGCIQTLFTPMMLTIGDAKTLGAIQSLSALGMVAGSLIISIRDLGKNQGIIFNSSLASGGIFLGFMAISTHMYLITMFFFLFLFCLPLINTSAELMIRRGTPNHEQGRIWGLTGLLSQTGYMLAYLSAAFLSDRVFTPLLLDRNSQASILGKLMGTGPGRGSALVILLCGAGFFLTAFWGQEKRRYQPKRRDTPGIERRENVVF